MNAESDPPRVALLGGTLQSFAYWLARVIDSDRFLTQHDVSVTAGVSDAAVSQWITEKRRPGARSLIRLIHLLGNRHSVDPDQFDRLMTSIREDLPTTVAAANDQILAVPLEEIRVADPRQAQIAALMIQDLADACHSADSGAKVYLRMCSEDRFATPQRSAMVRRIVQIIALAPRPQVIHLVTSLAGSWNLTTLAPNLVRFAPDTQSQFAAVDGLAQALIPCRAGSCGLDDGDPDAHLPDVFAFLYACRAATHVGMEHKIVDAIDAALVDHRDQCGSHSAFVLQAFLRLSRDQDCWAVASPLLKATASRLGLDSVTTDWAAMNGAAERSLIAAFVSQTRSEAPGYLMDWSQGPKWSDASVTSVASATGHRLREMAAASEGLVRCDQVFLASAVSSHLRESYQRFLDLDPRDQEISIYRKYLSEPIQAFLELETVSVMARLIIAESAIESEILNPGDAVSAFLDRTGPTGAMAMIASRWASPALRASASHGDPHFWSHFDMKIVDSQQNRLDESRMWISGRMLYSSPQKTAVG